MSAQDAASAAQAIYDGAGVEAVELPASGLGRLHPEIERRCAFRERADRMSRWMHPADVTS